MTRRALALLAALALAGCQERITAPADCPALCPGGSLELRDTVLTPEPGRDTTYPLVGGYVERGLGQGVLVSNGMLGADAHAVIRFVARADTTQVGDEWLPYTIDSLKFSLGVHARDTLATGLELLLYRIPPALADSTVTFDEIQPLLAAENLIATVEIPDTLDAGAVEVLFTGTDLAQVEIPAADSGVLALAVALQAPAPTGVRLGAIASGSVLLPRMLTYAEVDVEDEDERKRTINRASAFTTWVTSAEPSLDLSQLIVGGAPSKRALVRFPFPSLLRDSVGIVRATLELTPAETVTGLPNDPALLQVRAILADFGAKSPPISTTTVSPGRATLETPIDTVIKVDVTSIVRAWQLADSIPTAALLDLQPEGASFTRLVLESTATGGDAAGPRLRITYSLPFDFEAP